MSVNTYDRIVEVIISSNIIYYSYSYVPLDRIEITSIACLSKRDDVKVML